MPERTTFAISKDGRWVAELSWTDAPGNLAWFIHPFQADGQYDNLTVTDAFDDTGQSAEDVLAAWERSPHYA